VAQLAGHNGASFDGPRIQRLYKDAGAFLPADPRVLDTMQRAMWWFQERGIRPESFKLEALCNYFGIPIGEGETHDALADVRLTIQLARRLRDRDAEPAAVPSAEAIASGLSVPVATVRSDIRATDYSTQGGRK
jgi:DNA polymerase III epsilon subunit-like protein